MKAGLVVHCVFLRVVDALTEYGQVTGSTVENSMCLCEVKRCDVWERCDVCEEIGGKICSVCRHQVSFANNG